MDPVSLILQALVTGAAKAAGDAVPDAYKALRELIKRKFVSKPKAEMVLEEHEKDPETYEAPLKKNLVEAGADKDEEIIKKAQELLKLTNPEEAAVGKFNLKIDGNVQGLVQGDYNNTNMDFRGK